MNKMVYGFGSLIDGDYRWPYNPVDTFYTLLKKYEVYDNLLFADAEYGEGGRHSASFWKAFQLLPQEWVEKWTRVSPAYLNPNSTNDVMVWMVANTEESRSALEKDVVGEYVELRNVCACIERTVEDMYDYELKTFPLCCGVALVREGGDYEELAAACEEGDAMWSTYMQHVKYATTWSFVMIVTDEPATDAVLAHSSWSSDPLCGHTLSLFIIRQCDYIEPDWG